MDLENKVAIVTGTSRGIGRSITEVLLNEGVKIAGWSRSEPEHLSHPNFTYISCDLTDQDAVDEAFQQTTDELGDDIHILINNAGKGYKGAMDEMAPDKWRSLFDLNVHGIFYVTRLVIPKMKENKSGHIINISSGAGTNGIAEMSCYSATKHAVVGISRSLHQELRDFGIKVTCLSPGSVNTGFSGSQKNKLEPDDLAQSAVHILKCPQNFHYTDVQVRPLQP